MAGLQPFGDISEVFYNGFRFPPALSTSISSIPVYDDSERQVIYVTHRIEVEFIIHNGVDQPYAEAGVYAPIFPATTWESNLSAISDASLKAFRERLTTPGGHLVLNNIGFGGTRTNPAVDVITDVNYGPKPKLLSFENIAAGRAVRVRWQVEISLAENFCSESTNLAILCHNATQTWDITHSGMTNRTTTGYIVIRANTRLTPSQIDANVNGLTGEVQDTGTTRANARFPQIAIRQTANEFRDRINYPPLPGYERRQNFSLSMDKTRLDYELVDEEIESQNPYYPFAIKMQGQQRTSCENLTEMRGKWMSTIDATIRLDTQTNMFAAWIAFARIVERKLRAMEREAKVWGKNENNSTSGARPDSGHVFARRFSFTEGLFEPSFGFSVTFEIFCDRNFIFQAVNAGEPVFEDDITWRRWTDSIKDVHDFRGLSGLVFDNRTDILFGLCDTSDEFQEQQPQPVRPSRQQKARELRRQRNQKVEPTPYENNIEAAKSWLNYLSRVRFIEDTKRLSHHVLDVNEYTNTDNLYNAPANPTPGGLSPSTLAAKKQRASTSGLAGSAPVIQARGATKYFIEVSGMAERIRYPIGLPVVLQYAGVNAYPVGELLFDSFERRDAINGEVITKAVWSQRYQLAQKPRQERSALPNKSVNWS